MKLIFAVATILASSTSFAEIVLKDAAHGATLIFDRTTDAGKIVESQTWSIGATSRILKATFTDTADPTESTVAITRGQSTSRTDARISIRGAVVTSTARNGTGPASNIPLLKHLSIVDPSLLWFTKQHPEKGASVTFMHFDPEFRYWEEVTVTFEGRGKLGDSVEGNLVSRKEARSTIHMVLDDKGLPLVWEEGRLRLVRSKS